MTKEINTDTEVSLTISEPPKTSCSIIIFGVRETVRCSHRMVLRLNAWNAKAVGTITPTTRLHPHPLDWLAAGCTGACHIALISRKALKDLRNVESIECNDIATALDAWSWAFDADEAELSRFEVDDTPESINEYYERAARWHAIRVANDMEARHSW
jgi:hypothetical protein